MSLEDATTADRHRVLPCPYCGRLLHWVPNRWFGRGSFECEQCGDFPDFRGAAPNRPPPESEQPVAAPAVLRSNRPDRPRVLLIDDSPEHRDLYALMLEATATVLTASRGQDGLDMASADAPDVIVLDVMMPGMDGWEVCRRLKSNRATAAIPIVMLTSLDAVDVPARARQAGALAVLMKPCPIERLELTIATAMQSSLTSATSSPDCSQL